MYSNKITIVLYGDGNEVARFRAPYDEFGTKIEVAVVLEGGEEHLLGELAIDDDGAEWTKAK